MRNKILCTWLCLVLLLVLTLTATPVQAAAAMNPTQGMGGTFVALSGLTDGINYVIKWDGITFRSGVVPTGGTVSFFVPDAPRGPHCVVVENPAATIVLTTSFTVIPSIDISPFSGPSDSIITIVGRGFGAWEPNIGITYDGFIIRAGIQANGNGSWLAQFIVPSSSRGFHSVRAFGTVTSASELFNRSFVVTPLIKMNPISGCVGTTVAISGTGFSALEPNIEVTFDNFTVRTGVQSTIDGKWSATFNVPDANRGIHTLDASGANTPGNLVPDVVFTVMASAFIDPTAGNVGDLIRVIGKGFASHETGINLSYDSFVVRSNIVADEEGNWSTLMEIPASTNGTHDVGAYGSITTSLNCSSTTFNVMSKITLDPGGGNVGDNISLKGTGFNRQSPLVTAYGNDTVAPGIYTDDTGSFSTSFKVPAGMSGAIDIVVSDARGAMAKAVFTVETTPPPTPQLILPHNGDRVGFIGSSRVDFDWTDVSDPSGVYYVIEISPQLNFPHTLVRVTDLTSSQYTLSEAEALPYGEYYWRVLAVDKAGNASPWTSPWLLKISYMTIETFILVVVAFVIVIALASTLPILLRKKK